MRKRPSGSTMRWLAALEAGLDRLLAAGAVLVLPISVLLFAQWPLREWVQAGSREANDLAQCLFALYVALAITAATRQRTHLAADVVARRYSATTRRRLTRVAALGILLPWALWLLYTALPTVWRSVLQLESFPETFNPGYFVIKLGLALLALLVVVQALIDGLRTDPGDAP